MKKLVYNLILPLTFITLLFWSVIGVSLFRPFYDWQYSKNGTADHIGIDHGDLMLVTDKLLSYMSGFNDDLEMQYEVKGNVREIFDEREKLHMIDVQNLYLSVIYVAVALTALTVAGFIYLKKSDGAIAVKSTLRKKYKFAVIGLGAFLALTGGVFATNFQWFWTNFHYVFFTNDLWILDPRVSIMINMFPLNFFFAMCTAIVIVFALLCALVRVALVSKK